MLHDTLSSFQREELASICIDLAAGHLAMLRCQGHRIFYQLPDYHEKSLAADALADLFCASPPGVYHHLKKYLSRFTHELETQAGCFLVLRRLCGHRMQQHLRHFFYENDPEGAKLYRNIRLAAKRIKDAVLRKNMLGALLIYPFTEDGTARKRPSLIELERLASGRFHPAMQVEELVRIILQDAFKVYCLPVAVSLTDLYHLIKDFRSATRSRTDIMPPLDTFPVQWKELHQCMETILLDIHDTILDRYCRNGKLTGKEALSLYAALRDLANDLLLGEAASTNYAYIKRHWPTLTEENYYASTRKLYEYLVRTFKERIAAGSKLIF